MTHECVCLVPIDGPREPLAYLVTDLMNLTASYARVQMLLITGDDNILQVFWWHHDSRRGILVHSSFLLYLNDNSCKEVDYVLIV